MALDFVLQHPSDTFLATEDEKVRFFHDQLNVATDFLPAWRYPAKAQNSFTTRFFVDKFRIAISNAALEAVRFCYIDEGLHSTSGFERFLNQYRSLFTRLPKFQLVYLASFADSFAEARGLFARKGLVGGDVADDPMVSRLLSYFRARQAYAKRELTGFTVQVDPVSRRSYNVFWREIRPPICKLGARRRCRGCAPEVPLLRAIMGSLPPIDSRQTTPFSEVWLRATGGLMMNPLGEASHATRLHPLHHPALHPLVLIMWRYARRLAACSAVEEPAAGAGRQPGATPAGRQLRRHKPTPRSLPSLWGSPQAVFLKSVSDKESTCGPTFSR